MNPSIRGLIGTVIAIVLGVAIAIAGSHDSVQVSAAPLFALCVALAFVVQWIVFVPSYIKQTEHFYDLTGSLTYLSVVAFALAAGQPDARAMLVGLLTAIWALRLGSFLFIRIRKQGSDSRFDEIKPVFMRFLGAWTIQGLWVALTLAAGLAVMTTTRHTPLDAFAIVGALIWLFGFTIEALADRQKKQHRADPANDGRFIRTGLWAWSRHPNYFGEIVLWIGIAVIALPTLQGWTYATLVSPLFVYLLLTRLSGVPMLEKKADEKWGDDPEYQAYKRNTPVLFLRKPTEQRSK